MRRKSDGEDDENGLYALMHWAIGRTYGELFRRLKRYIQLVERIIDSSPTEELSEARRRRIRRIAVKMQMLDMYRSIADKDPERKYILR